MIGDQTKETERTHMGLLKLVFNT